MDDERWETVVDMIDDRYGIDRTERREEHRRDGSPEWHEAHEFVDVEGRLMKLERISRPRVLDVKTFYARRRAGDVREEVTYSDTERTHSVHLYEWANQGWVEVDVSNISR